MTFLKTTDPADEPHVFRRRMSDAEYIGGRTYPSAACAICGASELGNPKHIGVGESEQSMRERHGPFGE